MYLLPSTTMGSSNARQVLGQQAGPKAHLVAGSPKVETLGAGFWCSPNLQGEWQLVPESSPGHREAPRPGCLEGESCFPFKLIAEEPPESI